MSSFTAEKDVYIDEYKTFLGQSGGIGVKDWCCSLLCCIRIEMGKSSTNVCISLVRSFLFFWHFSLGRMFFAFTTVLTTCQVLV